jgi:hypothetical protein
MKSIPNNLFAAMYCTMLLFGACTTTPSSTFGPAGLALLDDAETRSVSAENITGEKGKGGMDDPRLTLDNRAMNARSADDLGAGWKVKPFLFVGAGETVTLMDVEGPGVIQHIWMVDGLSRQHVIRFYWDNEPNPSIEAPVPDFFAVGHEMFAPVNSDVVVVNPLNALNCFWPMPFRKHARVTLTNEGRDNLDLLAYQITFALTKVSGQMGYLHAQWRKGNTREQNPYVILDGVQGKGRYVGTFLAWTQLTDNIWFGEGEVKFFIDGDKDFPTYCGTGTEDYFLGSYGFKHSFSGLYSGTVLSDQCTDSLPNYWSLYRWHTRDPIAFHKDLKVTIQSLGWWRSGGKYRKLEDDIASVAFWYQTEPHQPFPPLPPADQRRRIE